MLNGIFLETTAKRNKNFNEVTMVEYAADYLKSWNKPQSWIDNIIQEYKAEKEILPPPKLSVASWTVAAMCITLVTQLGNRQTTTQFPKVLLVFNYGYSGLNQLIVCSKSKCFVYIGNLLKKISFRNICQQLRQEKLIVFYHNSLLCFHTFFAKY